jgi:hypothetical protein
MRLPPAPEDLARTRDALHAIAEHVLAPARVRATGNEIALESLRADAHDPSSIHLWPEHFDLAFDAGDEAAGRRATYGASPGDDDHPEPYLYVGPWRTPAPSEIWNAHGFTGAELAWAQLVIEPDPRAAAQRFWSTGRDALAR